MPVLETDKENKNQWRFKLFIVEKTSPRQIVSFDTALLASYTLWKNSFCSTIQKGSYREMKKLISRQLLCYTFFTLILPHEL